MVSFFANTAAIPTPPPIASPFIAMSGPSPPINIHPASARNSASPRHTSSNLTSQLQQAGATGINIPKQERLTPVRQDSLGYGLGRKESAGGNGHMPLGMSWSAMSTSFPNLIGEDLQMGGTSPFNFNYQSPSFHSSSYFPRMEANFWSNLRCCDEDFSDLHALVQHYEDVHSQNPSTFPSRMSQTGNSGRFWRRRSSNSSNANGASAAQQIRGFQPAMNGVHGSGAFNQTQRPPSHAHDMDTIGEMEMDEDQQMQFGNPPMHFQSSDVNQRPNAVRPPSINSNLANMMHPSAPSTPGTARGNNPMVSSVTTPTFTPRANKNQSQPQTSMGDDFMRTENRPFSPSILSNLNQSLNNLDFGTHPGSGMLDLCINDPARALFTNGGGIDARQAEHFGFANGALANFDLSDTSTQNPNIQQAANNAASRFKMLGQEDRPFTCPVIGCEKAYKNANGLRYHEKHGHSNQMLKANPDGSLSIVNPETSEPYPGTTGMEKEKPYQCETCGKRYKNLNGLKYHRNHSPPCNPDFKFDQVALPGMQMNESAVF